MLKLAVWRAQHGRTQQWVADQIDCTVGAVARYEGGTRIPDKSVMRKIFILTGGLVTPNDFYDLPKLDAKARAA